MRPDPETNNAFMYCLGLAARRTAVEVIAFLAHSNHHHTVVADPAGRLPEFLEALHKLFAKHQNSLRGRRENFWASEQTSVVELSSPDDVLAKIVYTLTNPVKDHLVERAIDWPGATSLAGTLEGRTMVARRPVRFFRVDGDLPVSLQFSCVRPPGFDDFDDVAWRKLLAEHLRAAEAKAAAERRGAGFAVLGRRRILSQNPFARPLTEKPASRLRPRVAAANKWSRIEALRRNSLFLVAYRLARDVWQSGFSAIFPEGTYWLRRFAGVPVGIAPT